MKDGKCLECPPYEVPGPHQHACTHAKRCDQKGSNPHVYFLTEKAECKKCPEYQRIKEDGKTCYECPCRDDEIVQKDGSCKKCEAGAKPDKTNRKCEATEGFKEGAAAFNLGLTTLTKAIEAGKKSTALPKIPDDSAAMKQLANIVERDHRE